MVQYNIEKKIGKLVLSLHGNMDEVTAKRFFKEFTAITNSIDPSQYELEIPAEGLSVATQNMQDSLKSALSLYKSLNFKKVTMELGNNAVLGMQVKRLAREVGLENFQII